MICIAFVNYTQNVLGNCYHPLSVPAPTAKGIAPSLILRDSVSIYINSKLHITGTSFLLVKLFMPGY